MPHDGGQVASSPWSSPDKKGLHVYKPLMELAPQHHSHYATKPAWILALMIFQIYSYHDYYHGSQLNALARK